MKVELTPEELNIICSTLNDWGMLQIDCGRLDNETLEKVNQISLKLSEQLWENTVKNSV